MLCRDVEGKAKLAREAIVAVSLLKNIGRNNTLASQVFRKPKAMLSCTYKLDLSSLASVRECASQVIETEDKIHLLVNNAGVAVSSSFILIFKSF